MRRHKLFITHRREDSLKLDAFDIRAVPVRALHLIVQGRLVVDVDNTGGRCAVQFIPHGVKQHLNAHLLLHLLPTLGPNQKRDRGESVLYKQGKVLLAAADNLSMTSDISTNVE